MLLIKGLTTWHSDTLSAWTMVSVFIISCYCLIKYRNLKALLIWCALMIDIPNSIMFHCSKSLDARLSENIKIHEKWLLRDIIAIYVGHTFLHFALSYKTPLAISSITLTLFCCVTYQLITELKEKPYHELHQISLKYIPIVLIHIIPMYFSDNIKGAFHYVILLILVFFPYKYELLEKVLPPGVMWSNFYMHIILNIVTCIFYKTAAP